MHIPLASRRRWPLPASLILLALVYITLCGIEFAASVLSSRTDRVSLQRAVRLSPRNADYHDRLGRFETFVAGDAQAALENFEVAVRLNPLAANYWLDLASARQITGDLRGSQDALEHALLAEPTAPRVAWQAATSFLVEGDLSRALREFRVVIDNDPEHADLALQYCWRAQPDVDLLLHEAE